jgi:hypothetical protein
MRNYDPLNWFWYIGGDESQSWSSAAGSYVTDIPDDVEPTRILSEDELTDVLAAYGLPGPAVRVPSSVSARQFKLQLLADGLLDQVEAFVASQGKAVQIAFEYSGSFVRSEPMMAAGFAALGKSAADVDAFFMAAAKL